MKVDEKIKPMCLIWKTTEIVLKRKATEFQKRKKIVLDQIEKALQEK